MSDGQPSTPVEYREIPRFPGYRFGSDGSVLSKWGKGYRGRQGGIWRRLKPCTGRRDGYQRVVIKLNGGKPFSITVHQLILEAFVGPCPGGMEVCHNNGIGSDNNFYNLRYGLKSENRNDMKLHGTLFMGSELPHAKLKEADIPVIRRRAANGRSMNAIAKDYGVNPSTIHDVVTRKCWKHVID